jgi:hypothetical protein
MHHLTRFLFISSFSLVSAAVIEEPPVFQSFAFGGGGDIVSLGTSNSMGVVVGQSYAELPSFATSGTGASKVILDVQHGFWISPVSLTTSSNRPSLPQNQFPVMQVKLLPGLLSIEVALQQPQVIQVQLIDLEGRSLMPIWKESLASGASHIELPIFVIGKQNLLVVVETGSAKKVFPIVSNVSK